MPKVTQLESYVQVSYPVREAVLDITKAEHDLIVSFSQEKVKMIKFIRAQYNLGLYDAKQVVDTVIASMEVEPEAKPTVKSVATELDWSKVKEGTTIYVKDCLYGDWCRRVFIRYNPDSVYSFTCKALDSNGECVWQRAKLAND